MKVLPHRYPFLMVDRVVEMTEITLSRRKMSALMSLILRAIFPIIPSCREYCS